MTQQAKMDTDKNGNGNINSTNKSSRELEQEIGQTREAISDDIRALGDKVSPAALKAEAKVALTEAKDAAIGKVKSVVAEKALEVKEAAAEKVEEVKEMAMHTYDEVSYQTRRATQATWSYTKDNAVPLTLIGVGAGLLLMNGRRGREERLSGPAMRRPYRPEGRDARTERPRGDMMSGPDGLEYESATDYESRSDYASTSSDISQLGSHAGERARGRYANAGAALHNVESRIAESAARGRDYAKDRLARARDGTRDFAQENPLPLALATVALGIGVGLLLPSTSRESTLLAPTADKLGRMVDDARHAARDVAEVAKATVKDAVQTGT